MFQTAQQLTQVMLLTVPIIQQTILVIPAIQVILAILAILATLTILVMFQIKLLMFKIKLKHKIMFLLDLKN